MNYIFIDSKEETNKVGIVEKDRLVEFYSEKISKKTLVGNVYRARVSNVLPGMEAAFVDIGEDKNAYLFVKDALSKEQLYSHERFRINDVIKSGEEVIVQIIKEPLGNKGAKVSTHISIPGRYIVITPYSNRVHISKKITSHEDLKALKSLGKDIMKDEIGIIFRTVSQGIEESLIRAEYDTLLEIYDRIEMERTFLPSPKLIYKDLDLIYQIVRDTFNDKDYKIIVNNKEVFDNLLLLEDYFSYELKDKIVLDLEFSIELDSKIQKDIKEAIGRKVFLKSGGYIVIDETEALTAIDVNTGKYIGDYSLGDTVFKANTEAAFEIARQIRLRDIGGIIIVDFIDMKDKRHASIVMSTLEELFLKDRNKPYIVDITKLGLVEITRKKIRPTLDSKVTAICPECNGKGRIRKID